VGTRVGQDMLMRKTPVPAWNWTPVTELTTSLFTDWLNYIF
jgi:hypothetical protein